MKIELTEMVIPTYRRGPDDPCPPLGFGRGSACYPYSRQDDVDIESGARHFDLHARHRVIRIANGILEALVLPDMNGRLYALRELQTGREIFYRNPVVKPGLVALRGAWLSGGIEFNFPSVGHSVSTVSPVFFRLERSREEVAAIVGDIDRQTRQRWQVRLALRRGRAALDLTTLFQNPNPWRERLYFWENAAVPAAADLRFVCKADWALAGGEPLPFPIRDGRDIAWYGNNAKWCDHFGYRSHRDFFGAWYRDRRLGTYRVGPRHQSPGQKYFTWGTGTDSRIWLKFLTDRADQYVEIQSGTLETQYVTDWLQPAETLVTRGSWFGASDASELTWANTRLGVAVAESGRELRLDLVPLEDLGACDLLLGRGRRRLVRRIQCQAGQTVHTHLAGLEPVTVEVRTRQGELLLRETWHGSGSAGMDPGRPRAKPAPWPIQARTTPSWRAVEQAEKYHQWVPMRNHLASCTDEVQRDGFTALLHFKTGRIDPARAPIDRALQADPGDPEKHFVAAAIALRSARLHPTPETFERVRDHLMAARRDIRFFPPAVRLLAESALLQGRDLEARAMLSEAIGPQADPEVLALYAALLRRTGAIAQARTFLSHQACLWPHLHGEAFLLALPAAAAPTLPGGGPPGSPEAVQQAELALEWLLLYWRARWYDDLLRLLNWAESRWSSLHRHPLAHLLRADALAATGNPSAARTEWKRAAACDTAFVFPSRWEESVLLEQALQALGPAAPPSLAFLLALYRAENNGDRDAGRGLRRAVSPRAPAALRCRAHQVLARRHIVEGSDHRRAARELQQALAACPRPDRRLFLALEEEWTRLHDRRRRERLLARIPAAWRTRSDIAFVQARLLFHSDRLEAALDLLRTHTFSVYEGGFGVRRLYIDTLLALGLKGLRRNQLAPAERYLRDSLAYPENVGAGENYGEHGRLARFLLGWIAMRQGLGAAARTLWEEIRGPDLTKAYVVPGAGSTSAFRMDEWVAIELAKRHLASGRKSSSRGSSGTPWPRSADPEELAIRRLARRIQRGQYAAACRCGAAARRRYPCANLLSILHDLARVLRA